MTDHDQLLREMDEAALLFDRTRHGRDLARWAAALRAALATQPEPLSPRTLEAAINCVEACADDPREPERYRREWYAAALIELRAAAGSATPDIGAALRRQGDPNATLAAIAGPPSATSEEDD